MRFASPDMTLAKLAEPVGSAMPGSLAESGGLHEVYAQSGDWGAVTAFALAMVGRARGGAIVVIRAGRHQPHDFIYGEGLADLDLPPGRLLFAYAKDTLEMLRAGAEASRCRGVAALVLEAWGRCPEWGLTASRRFSLAAERSGVAVLMLRGDAQPQPSSAQTRWAVASAPSTPFEAQAPGLPAIDVELLRQRGGPAGMRWRLEWNEQHGGFREAPLPCAVVSLPGLRTGPAKLPAAIPHAA